MLIRERGEPSASRTFLLKSSPIISEIFSKDSLRVDASSSVFFSPPPALSTDGIVKVIFVILSNYPITAEIFATSACITCGFVRTLIIDSVALRPLPVT